MISTTSTRPSISKLSLTKGKAKNKPKRQAKITTPQRKDLWLPTIKADRLKTVDSQEFIKPQNPSEYKTETFQKPKSLYQAITRHKSLKKVQGHTKDPISKDGLQVIKTVRMEMGIVTSFIGQMSQRRCSKVHKTSQWLIDTRLKWEISIAMGSKTDWFLIQEQTRPQDSFPTVKCCIPQTDHPCKVRPHIVTMRPI